MVELALRILALFIIMDAWIIKIGTEAFPSAAAVEACPAANRSPEQAWERTV